MKSPISPCGICCEKCDAFIATRDNNEALFDKLAADYQKNMGTTITKDELHCVGCTQTGQHISFCAECEIRSCASSKGYQTCAQCIDFPCEKGSFIWKDGSESLKQLESLRQS